MTTKNKKLVWTHPSQLPVTARQLRILSLAAQGYTSRAIGGQLGLSRRTVDNHIYRMADRVGLRTRVELVLWCRERMR